MTKTLKIEETTLYIAEDYNPYHTAFITLEPADFETAMKELWRQKKAYRAHGWDFWGDAVYQFNYLDDENRDKLIDFLADNGVGNKRAKRIADELIKRHRYSEDLEGVKMD